MARQYSDKPTTKTFQTKKINKTAWDALFVEVIHEYTYEIWKKRNEILHGKEYKIAKQKRIDRCREKIKEMYKRNRTHLNDYEKRLFALPCKARLRKGINSMEAWLTLVSSIFKDATDKNGKQLPEKGQTTIMDWMIREFGSKEERELVNTQTGNTKTGNNGPKNK